MPKFFFRILGAAHGIAGLATLALAVYLAAVGGWAALGPPHQLSVPIVSGVVVFLSLIACGVATWVRPSFAAPLAWLAALAYSAPMLVLALRSDNLLLPEFYRSTCIRLLAAGALTLLARHPAVRLTSRSSGRATRAA